MDDRAHQAMAVSTAYAGEDFHKSIKAGKLSLPERQRDAAQYLADMILEMRNLAKSAQLHTVMVPLEYAYYEAFSVANRVSVPDSEVERIRELSRTPEEYDETPESY